MIEERAPMFDKRIYIDAGGHQLPYRLLHPEPQDPQWLYYSQRDEGK